MLHSKIVTVDDRWCLLGSANMDMRSFRLNFEITFLVYDGPIANRLAERVDRHCHHARRLTPRDAHPRSVRRQITQGAARMMAPLL